MVVNGRPYQRHYEVGRARLRLLGKHTISQSSQDNCDESV